MTVKTTIREYILENYLFTEDQSALADDVSFMDEGIIDSTGVMELIAFLKEEFDVDVEDDEMIPENLDSVDNLVAFIAKKRNYLASSAIA